MNFINGFRTHFPAVVVWILHFLFLTLGYERVDTQNFCSQLTFLIACSPLDETYATHWSEHLVLVKRSLLRLSNCWNLGDLGVREIFRGRSFLLENVNCAVFVLRRQGAMLDFRESAKVGCLIREHVSIGRLSLLLNCQVADWVSELLLRRVLFTLYYFTKLHL